MRAHLRLTPTFLVALCNLVCSHIQCRGFTPISSAKARGYPTSTKSTMHMIGNSDEIGDYMVKEFSQFEDLAEIVQLASQPIPERPDGIVCVAKFTSAALPDCQATEGDYERLARSNPATIFLRCFKEYESAELLLGKADVTVMPTFDIFYGGNRVARVEGSNYADLEELLNRFQLQNSQLDLFSEGASWKRDTQWGDATAPNPIATPRTTNRFIPGYDWNSKNGFFDEQGEKAEQSFEDAFGNWVPNIDDDDDDGRPSKA